MKKIILPLLIIALGAVTYQLNKKSDLSQDRRIFKKEGIGNALNHYYMSRAYPSGTIPSSKIQKEFIKKSNASQSKSSGNPWELLGPENFAGRTLCLAFNSENPNTLFAGSASGGLWRSYTNGSGSQAWHQVNIPSGSNSIGSIAIHPTDSNTIIIGTGEVYNYEYVGTGEHVWMTRGIPGVGMFKTTNYGDTWTQVSSLNLDDLQSFNMIKYDPNNVNILYAAGTNGLYKSIDSGDSWSQIYAVKNVTDLLIQPSNSNNVLFSCGNLSSPNGGVYKSTDAGSNFSLVSTSFPAFNGKIMLAISPDNDNMVSASVGYPSQAKELFSSSNFGDAWTGYNIEFTYGWYAHDLVYEPGNTNRLICAGVDIYRYTFSNSNLSQRSDWTQWDSNPPIDGPGGPDDYVHGDIHDIIYHPTNPNEVFFATDGGVFVSTNDAGTFSSRNSGLVTTQFYSGMASSQQDENYFIGGLQDNGTVRYTGNGQWERILGGDGAYCGINSEDDNYVFGSTYNLIMYRSTDNGQNFDYINDLPYHGDDNSAFISPFELAPGTPSTLYGATTQLFKSTNNGGSWSFPGSEFDNGKTATDIAISYSNTNKVYVATCPLRQIDIGQFTYTDRSRIFVTETGGSSYTDVTNNLPDRFVTDLDLSPNDDNVLFATLGGYGTDHIFKSNDGGSTWNSLDGLNLPDVPFNTIELDPNNPNIIYAGCDFGMYSSIDGGSTWDVMSDGLPSSVIVMDISYQKSAKKLRIGTHGNGAYQTDLLSNDIISIQQEIDYSIEIFPNPTSDYLNIQGDFDQVNIYNLEGKLVHSTKETRIDISSYVNGVYLIVANDGYKVFTKEIIKQ